MMKRQFSPGYESAATGRSSELRPVVTLTTGEEVEVGTIFCVGRNYALHAREMGSDAPSEPFFFFKPVTALLASGESIVIPEISDHVHHELELVYLLDRRLSNVGEDEAAAGIAAVAVGLDMTMRDIQSRAKKEGKPWSLAKGFDTSAPVGPFLRLERGALQESLEFQLFVNDELRQKGTSDDMLFSPAAVVSWLSRFFTLRPGDLIFSGTPEGVARVEEGDRLVAGIVDRDECRLEVTVVGRSDPGVPQ